MKSKMFLFHKGLRWTVLCSPVLFLSLPSCAHVPKFPSHQTEPYSLHQEQRRSPSPQARNQETEITIPKGEVAVPKINLPSSTRTHTALKSKSLTRGKPSPSFSAIHSVPVTPQPWLPNYPTPSRPIVASGDGTTIAIALGIAAVVAIVVIVGASGGLFGEEGGQGNSGNY